MATANTTEEAVCAWPAQFGAWAERAPSIDALCRSTRRVPWILRPPSLADLERVVAEAVRAGTPLWPLSRGGNWAYGSRLPARDGSVVVDLGALDQISDIDRSTLSVRIEPGVTQAALADYLRLQAPDLAFNVTGSGRLTSVLGNALDRGTGYSGERDQELYALEVLLSDGSMVAPVAGRHHPARVHPAGPSTDALFFQSNFGIVVGARFRLRVRQESEFAVVVQGSLEAVLGVVKQGYDQSLIGHPTHVAEPGRSQRLGFGLLRGLWNRDPSPEEVTRCFPEQKHYNALFGLYGRRTVVNAAWRELRGLAPARVRLQRADAAKVATASAWLGRLGAKYKAARLRALRPLLALVWGEPSDVGLASLDGYRGGDPDRAIRGAIYGNAVSAVDPAAARRTSEIVRKHWPDSAFTWIVLDARCMLTIYTLHFDAGAADGARAASWSIVQELRAAGYPSYRLDINTPAAPGSENIIERLKAALDPAAILSPGRYES